MDGAIRDVGELAQILQPTILDDFGLDAVRAVAEGKGCLSPEVSDAALTEYRNRSSDPLDL